LIEWLEEWQKAAPGRRVEIESRGEEWLSIFDFGRVSLDNAPNEVRELA
jgi:hypothetical protein